MEYEPTGMQEQKEEQVHHAKQPTRVHAPGTHSPRGARRQSRAQPGQSQESDDEGTQKSSSPTFRQLEGGWISWSAFAHPLRSLLTTPSGCSPSALLRSELAP
jgi:hypothetical protein